MSHLSVSNLCTWTSTPMPDCLPQATFMHKWAIFGPTYVAMSLNFYWVPHPLEFAEAFHRIRDVPIILVPQNCSYLQDVPVKCPFWVWYKITRNRSGEKCQDNSHLLCLSPPEAHRLDELSQHLLWGVVQQVVDGQPMCFQPLHCGKVHLQYRDSWLIESLIIQNLLTIRKVTSSLVWLDIIRLTRHWNLAQAKNHTNF